jgi:hypothetical protein
MDKALEAGVQMFRKACPQINGAVSDTTLNVAFGLAVRAVIDALAEDEETVERVARALKEHYAEHEIADWIDGARAALAALKGEVK